MADSDASSVLSDPPSVDQNSDTEDQLSTGVPSSRPSVDITHADLDHRPPPAKRRKLTTTTLGTHSRVPSPPAADDDDTLSISSDDYSSAPGSPSHSEWALREEAQTFCLWKDCPYGEAYNNDDLVKHVQSTHCATGGPKKTKYVCEWGECQRKTSNHPSGYALKAHMRSHTKEKPYYCALPECDKAFTRSDALAKHMRTVHEPEGPRATANDPPPSTKKGPKPKAANGIGKLHEVPPGPTVDEDGNEVEPSAPNDNITYIPAHHPITGQPGFMIHYPPDIQFTSWESGIPANHLMHLLRGQLSWAETEGEELKKENEELELVKRHEWELKEILLEGVMEAELATAARDGLLRDVDATVRDAMENDVEPSKRLRWTGGSPSWRRPPPNEDSPTREEEASPSPPPTGKSGGGFDGDGDPYDNYLDGRLAELEQMARLKSMHSTPQKAQTEQQAAEADAVGALLGMSGGAPKS